MMNKILIAVMFTFLVLLTACADATLRTKPLNVTEPNPCEGIACGEDMQCVSGECVCPDEEKVCGDSCISQQSCCTNDECGDDRTCTNNVCVSRPVCGYNEAWDDDRKECGCADTAKFCFEQGKCIPADSCCWHSSCGDNNRCTRTVYSATICLTAEDGSEKCRLVHEITSEPFQFTDKRYEIEVVRVLEGGAVDVKIDDAIFRGMSINNSKPVDDDRNVFVESLEFFGGYCREEPD